MPLSSPSSAASATSGNGPSLTFLQVVCCAIHGVAEREHANVGTERRYRAADVGAEGQRQRLAKGALAFADQPVPRPDDPLPTFGPAYEPAPLDFPKWALCADIGKRNIEMTPLCKIEVTLPRVPGSRGLRRGGVVDEQAGVQPS